MKFLVILAGLLCISNAQTTTGCAYNNQYMVQSGNTFWQLGGSTWAGMCAWLNANPGVDPCNLKIGQCVNAPVSGYTSTTCNSADLAWSCVTANGYPSGTYYGSGYYSGPTYSTSVSSYCGYNQRQVVSGDTIWNIAGQTWANTCAWLNANPGVNPCTLQAGQCLNAPTTSTSTACQSSFSAYSCLGSVPYWSGSGSYCPYTVQSGNTYWSLGGSTWAGTCAWLNANPGVDPCNLQIGQCLNTPTSYTSRTCSSLPSCFSGYSASTCSGCYSTYTVQSGTTYYGLVSRYTSDPTTINNCLAQIEACNPSYVSTNLQVGQTLCLPACASGYYGK